ncbi:hypothetical protein KLP28_10615 [Nocardioidaceae bacterium]|nr:hypothetical protein KLP28_10615 [Nocardioidaceae bacterium]
MTTQPPDGPRPERSLPVPDPVEALSDLESQAAAWSREEREAEVDDRVVEAYRSVTLAARLVASLGRDLVVDLGRAGRVRGELTGAGDGWAVLEDDRGVETVVLTEAVSVVHGAVHAAASAAAWPLSSRRSLAASLTRQLADQAPVVLTLRDGERRSGRGRRVGADFLELGVDDGGTVLVALSAVATVRRA